MTVTWLVAGRTGPNAARIMPKVHDMWVNSLAALLGALAAIRSDFYECVTPWVYCVMLNLTHCFLIWFAKMSNTRPSPASSNRVSK